MRRSTLVIVLALAALMLLAGTMAHGRGGGAIGRWIASLHRTGAPH